jgi:PAS domain S-box-containing protein
LRPKRRSVSASPIARSWGMPNGYRIPPISNSRGSAENFDLSIKSNSKKKKRRTPKKNAVRPKARKPNPVGESQEIVLAIRRGKIDALVIEGAEGEQVLTLQDSDHAYRVLVETINDGVATLDPAGTILYANSRFAAILRSPAANFIGTPLYAHISPADREPLETLISQAGSGSTQGEVTLNVADGRTRIVRLALAPINDSGQGHLCVVATELTELVEANEALRSNEESLQLLSARLLKLQDEERRHIARDLHDITGQKLALQSLTLSQLLARQQMSADSQKLVSECVTLNRQISEDVRTLSYLLHPPLLDELGLSSAVKWYAEGFEKRTGIRVDVDIAANFVRLPPDVEVALFRIIQESLNNVHRYSGSRTAGVQVRATPEKKIEVKVKDFGKGISPGMLNASTGAVAPIGVGIQGMKERIRQLAGKLEITSRVNRGTVVTATIPVPANNAPAASEPAAPQADHAAETGARKQRGSRNKILIADDHELLRRGIRAMFETETEWEICGEAINGQDAVDKARGLRPDLVILDINMPVLNGLAAVRQILRGSPESKILVFTIHDSDQTAAEVKEAGAHGYVSKKNAGADLLRVARDLLNDGRSDSAALAAHTL